MYGNGVTLETDNPNQIITVNMEKEGSQICMNIDLKLTFDGIFVRVTAWHN